MKRPQRLPRALCGYAVIWAVVVIILFCCIHSDGGEEGRWSEFYSDLSDHHGRRLQRDADHKAYDTTSEKDSTETTFILNRPPLPTDTDDWREFRDNVRRVKDLDYEGLAELKAKARSAEYCNPPGSALSGEEGAVPDEFELQQVHVVIRHGSRSPIYRFPGNFTNSCLFQPETDSDRRFLTDMRTLQSKLPLQSEAYNFRVYPSDERCRGGQLTGEGARQLLELGSYLARKYVDNMGLLSANYTSSQLYVRSTRTSRTFQSAMAFLYGFLPEFNYDKLVIDFTAQSNMASIYQHERTSCPVLKSLSSAIERQRHRAWINNSLDISIKQDFAKILNTTESKLPYNRALLDGLSAYTCTGKTLPCLDGSDNCVNWAMIGRLWKYTDINGAQLLEDYANDKKMRITMHPLLSEIARRMRADTNSSDTYRLILYSGHDLTLSPLATALGIHDGKWPPFASRIIFELYRDLNTDQKYIRIIHNGHDVTSRVRFCSNESAFQGLCPLSRFILFVTEDNLKAFGASTYKDACQRKKHSLTGVQNLKTKTKVNT